jgi:hypothetical protein
LSTLRSYSLIERSIASYGYDQIPAARSYYNRNDTLFVLTEVETATFNELVCLQIEGKTIVNKLHDATAL